MAKYLYKIWQEVNDSYDTYDSAIVCAESEDEAKQVKVGDLYSWANPKDVQVQKIGKADKLIQKGVILASFNSAG